MSDDRSLIDDGVSRHQPLPLARLDRGEVACLKRELWRAVKFFGAGMLALGLPGMMLTTLVRVSGSVRAVRPRPPPPTSQNVASGNGGNFGASQAPDDADAGFRSGGYCDIGGEESSERSR